MTKKVMFIGAGKYQAPGLVKAKEMGLFVIATDGDPSAPGLKSADLSHVLDVRDIKSNLKVARDNSIDGILTIASDACLETVGIIAGELKLASLELDVIHRCIDKELMRKSFVEHGIPSPVSLAVFNYDECLEKAPIIGYPIVIKPSDNAGSRGVQLVTSESGLKDAYNSAFENSRNGKVLIEEFIKGIEVSVETFMYKGEMNLIAVSDKIRTQPPYLLDTEVIFPTAYPAEIQEQIIETAKKAIKAVGIETGPVHMELMVTQNGPVPVEIAARGPGFKVFTHILPMITGIDLLKASIHIALNEKPFIEKNLDMASVIKFIDTPSGALKKISGLEEARKVEGIHEVEIYVKEGDKVSALTCGSNRVGHIISLANSRPAAEKAVKNALSLLELQIEETKTTTH